MQGVKDFLNRSFIKSASLGLLTLIIGGICSALGTWDYSNDPKFKFKFILLIVFIGIYLFLLAFYATYEANMKKVMELYEKQDKAYEETLSSLISTCKLSADGANRVIHEIISKSEANLGIWNFDISCQWICKKMYSLLCIIGVGKDFEVIYNRLDESIKPEKYVYVNAYANRNTQQPSVYNKRREISSDNFFDVELFRNNQAGIQVIIGYEQIDEVFEHRTREKRNKNKKKYNQYIAIPIFCNDKKMIGIIEIACLNHTIIAEDKDEIEEIISKYFIPYAFLALVLHKLERALVAKPV